MLNSKKGGVQPVPNVQKSEILFITLPMINRMKIEDKSQQTITSYVRAVERLVRFHDLVHPRELDIDEVYDYLVSLNDSMIYFLSSIFIVYSLYQVNCIHYLGITKNYFMMQ